MQLHVGCSGWSYRHWRGNFYPDKLPSTRWLEHYAAVFDTVELNNTFYRLPSEAAVRAWRERVPEGFCFSAKVSRLITHFLRLRNAEDALGRYLERIRPLGDRLGPLLYQLPPDFERDDTRLDAFLKLLPPDLTHVFEFRHSSWWHEDVQRILAEHGAAFCAYDMGKTETPVVALSGVFYLRFHGPEGTYTGSYEDPELRDWAQKILATGANDAWVYFNNDIGGNAHRDAQRLREMLRSSIEM